MGATSNPEPVMLIAAAFSRHDAALDWALERAEAAWGAIELASPRFEFRETDYYEPTMGAGIKKCFWAFARLADSGSVVEAKLQSNAWEAEYAALGRHAEPRPLNIDPGYLTAAKLVLASTKDHAHRIYLGQGIYAEVTLNFRDHAWQALPWTFPDYRRDDYQAFFSQCRDRLRASERERRRR